MTHPHRWLRAAHKIAPNGARFHGISYYWQSCTERSRPFPTNPPKVRNCRVRFIDSLGFPLWGKLSPQVTDEGATSGYFPLIRRVPRHLPPKGKAFPPAQYCFNHPIPPHRPTTQKSRASCAAFLRIVIIFRGRWLSAGLPSRRGSKSTAQ